MNDRIKEEAMMPPAAAPAPAPRAGLRARAARLAAPLRKRGAFGIAAVVCAACTAYWGVLASDRYVSQANVIVQRTDLSGV
jgi:capsular polysaccharide transport system permease protein